MPLCGGADNKSKSTDWPQQHGYKTDIAKAKALMAEAGYPERLRDHAVFDLGLAGISEPLAVLVQESLAQIGIKVTINKIPGANWRAELLKKSMPMIINAFGGWLNYPEYFFFWSYHGQNAVFNTMSLPEPGDGQADRRRALRPRDPRYEAEVKGFIDIAFDEVPRIPLFQPFSTWRCRRTSPATATGSTASSTSASSRRADARSPDAGRSLHERPIARGPRLLRFAGWRRRVPEHRRRGRSSRSC